MDNEERTRAFLTLDKKIGSLSAGRRNAMYSKAMAANPWFTREHLDLAFAGLRRYLSEPDLSQWMAAYDLSPSGIRTVGVVMAGNIPMVGIHDFLCVLLSGHRINVKLSSNDDVLIPWVADLLIDVDHRFSDRIEFSQRLTTYDAVIATGSDNSSRYFKYYFGHVPHLIRKNRTSLAVLTGSEDDHDLRGLAGDMHEYYGLGCRNVSKIMVPDEYDIRILLPFMERYGHFLQHHKYANNYDYQKTIFIMNNYPYIDTGAGLLKEDDRLFSPVSVTYYSRYSDPDTLLAYVDHNKDKIQCIVSNSGSIQHAVPFGQAQRPAVWDYADGVDTMAFLSQL